MNAIKNIIITFFLLLIYETAFSQITVTTGIPVNTLVQDVLVGQGVTVSNVTYTGHPSAIGRFQTGAVPSNLGISEGIFISTGVVNGTPVVGSAASNVASTNNSYGGQSQLTTLAGYTTYDAALIDFDFVPLSDTIKFRYVFGSEEYHEYVNSGFNDVFAFFISGPNPLGGTYNNVNIAKLPNSMTIVSIDNVNNGNTYNDCSTGPCVNCSYFVDNCFGTSVVYDAFTVVLTAKAVVVPCSLYHLRIGIADAGDGILDSGVFLEANSFITNAVSLNSYVSVPTIGSDAIESCNNSIIEFSLPAPAPVNRVVPFTIGGTATNGVDYQTIPNSVTIPAGQSMTSLTIVPIYDAIAEPTETVILTVQTSSCSTDDVSVNILDYTQVTATGTGSTSICAGGGPVTVGVTPTNGMAPYAFAWDNGLPATQTNSVSPVATTTYNVTVSDACGFTATASVTVTVSNNNNITIDPTSPSICLGSDVTLSASGGVVFNWNNGQNTSSITVSPTTTTTYSVTGTDNAGCSGTAQVTVDVFPNLTVTIDPVNPQICEGDDIVLIATSNGTNPDFLWSTGDLSAAITVLPQTTTDYIVNVTDAAGCTGSAQVTVEVFPIPQVFFEGSPLSGCAPLTVNFSNLSDPGTSSWQFGDGSVSSVDNPVHQYHGSGLFSVTLTVSNAGCQNTITIPDYVNVFPNAIAGFHPSETNVYEDESTVLFFDLSLGASSWYWDFGTGTSDGFSNLQNPEYTFPEVGRYQVWQYVNNQWGCKDSTFKYITVKPIITFYIPNAFSPNDDGINEYFMPFGNNVDPDDYFMLIYDRWGKQIFRSDNPNNPWKGTSTSHHDKIAPPGIYVYYIRASFDGVVKTYEGIVTLIK